jgi:hypothetical protein
LWRWCGKACGVGAEKQSFPLFIIGDKELSISASMANAGNTDSIQTYDPPNMFAGKGACSYLLDYCNILTYALLVCSMMMPFL